VLSLHQYIQDSSKINWLSQLTVMPQVGHLNKSPTHNESKLDMFCTF